ncbi:MAG: hypothetical protein AAFZ87_01675 [Planctomycetota bacterium]
MRRLRSVPRWTLRRVPRAFSRVAGALALLFGVHAAVACSSAGLMPNLAVPTAGGQQLWTDVAWDGGWRVQQHVWTGHARVLDGSDVRRGWGGVDACLAAFDEARPRQGSQRPLVVALHGLWRSRGSLGPMKRALEGAGFEVFDVTYPSTRGTIEDHAESVARVLDRMRVPKSGIGGEPREIHFVTHSLGALVTRALLAREGDAWRERHRLGRAVFIAAPHQGAELARVAARIPGALCVYGAPARQIAGGETRDLPVPPLPFLNVAAGHGADGWNPFVEGDDDGVVAVREARLDGEAAFLRVEGVHTFVAQDPEVVERTVEFLGAHAGDTH